MTVINQTIEVLPVEQLIPYARNSRTHSDEQVAQIAASIREFGFTNPVLIDADGGIIAGHGRVMGARKLGMDAVPCIRLGYMTEAQKRAYVIADNKLALNAGWDEDMLSVELKELADMDFDLELTGFDSRELDKILVFYADEIGMPDLPVGDKQPFQQMTFTLHDNQAEIVKECIEIAKRMGAFINQENENSNGNALSRICEMFKVKYAIS